MAKIGCLGCTKLEYLESTGTQYIDTEYIPKINTKIELTLMFDGDFRIYNPYGGGTSNTIIFGSSNKKDSVFQLNFGGGASQGNKLYPWIDKPYGQGGSSYGFGIDYDIIQNKNTIMISSGLLTYGTFSENLPIKTTNNDLSLILFGGNEAGSIHSFNAYYMFVYGMQLYEGEELKRDYIPVLDKNKRPCMFDKVSKTCFYNKGTGEFLYG